MKQLPIPVLNVYPCEGASLCSLCMLSGFGVKDGHVVSTGCIFPWGALSATALVEGRDGSGVPGARARCELGILLGSVVVVLLGVGLGPKGLGHES